MKIEKIKIKSIEIFIKKFNFKNVYFNIKYNILINIKFLYLKITL